MWNIYTVELYSGGKRNENGYNLRSLDLVAHEDGMGVSQILLQPVTSVPGRFNTFFWHQAST